MVSPTQGDNNIPFFGQNNNTKDGCEGEKHSQRQKTMLCEEIVRKHIILLFGDKLQNTCT